MLRRHAAVALVAAVAAPIAAQASPKDLAIHFSVPGLSVTYVDPGFRVAAPVYRAPQAYAPVYAYPAPAYGPPAAYYPAPVYRPALAPVYAPVYRPAYPVVAHHGHGHWAHPGHRHPHHHGNAGHPGRHGHDGHRGHWR